MAEHRIMYVCTDCADGYPEGCGYFSRGDLRLMPSGSWLCEACFDDTTSGDRGEDPDSDSFKGWNDFPQPPEYGPLTVDPVGPSQVSGGQDAD